MAIDGGPAELLLDTFGSRPAISPDGRQIAFFYQASPSAPIQLAVVPASGGKPAMTFPANYSTAYATVRWTLDGKALLHNAALADRSNVWLQPLAGGPPQQITKFADQEIYGFDRTSDGTRLIVARGMLNRDAMLIRNFR